MGFYFIYLLEIELNCESGLYDCNREGVDADQKW